MIRDFYLPLLNKTLIMEVEFLCRYGKVLPKAQEEDLDAQAKALLLVDSSGELTLEEARYRILNEDGEYEYGPWTLNTHDISDYSRVDKQHTKIIKKNGLMLILKIPYEDFRAIKQMTTGILATTAESLIPPQYKQVIKRKKDGK